MKFIVISLKKYFFTIFFFLFFISLIIFSENNFLATKNGLALWFNSVLPSLLPFFIATELLSKTDFIKIVGNYFHKYIKPVFNVPGESIVAILIGIISGYPIGAKVVCDLYDQKICSKPEAERLIAYTSNSSPIFILSTIGISLFGNIKLGAILLLSHIISSLCVGLVFRFWKKDCVELNYRTYSTSNNNLMKLSNLGEILGNAISKSIYNVLIVGGFIVFFSVLLSIISSYGIINVLANLLSNFNIPEYFSSSLLTGTLELTNGVFLSSSFYHSSPLVSLLLTSFLLGFGGISILLQIFSITSKHHISIKPYIYGKILQGFFSVILTYSILLFFNI